MDAAIVLSSYKIGMEEKNTLNKWLLLVCIQSQEVV